MVATNQQTIGNILISGALVAFLFSTFLATVVFDKPSKCTDAYIPEIEMAMKADPLEQHIDMWVDAFLPMHTIVDIVNVKKVNKKTGVVKPGGMIDLFPSNGPATGRGTFVFKVEVVDRKTLPDLNHANFTKKKLIPAAYIRESTFTNFKKGYLKFMALYIKYFKYLVYLVIVGAFSSIILGALILYREKLISKKKTPVHATVEIHGDTYGDARGGHSMIKTPTHDFPTPIRHFEIPKSYTATDPRGLLSVSPNIPAYQTTPVHAFETPLHTNNAGQPNTLMETPVVAFMETPSSDAVETPIDVIVEPMIPEDEFAPEEEGGAAGTPIEIEAQVEETVTASVETLVHDLVDRIAPAATDDSVRSSVKTMVHSMVEKLVHTLVETLNVNTRPATPEPPVAESPIETLEDALRDTPEVEEDPEVQIIEVKPNPDEETPPE